MFRLALGFDVSFRTGYSALRFDDDGSMRYLIGGVVSGKSTVWHRYQIIEMLFKLGPRFNPECRDVCIGIEQPLPHAGNALYTIEAAKRIGEIRMLAGVYGYLNYTENHPSQMRSFVLNQRFSGKTPIEAFVNEYLRGKSERVIVEDEADSCVHAFITAGVFGWMEFPEPWRMAIIQKVRSNPLQLTDWRAGTTPPKI